MSKTDVLIIGDGILGISVALALTNEQQDIRITIIGENKSGVESSSSLAAGAMLGCFGEVTDLTLKSKHGRYWLDIAKQAKGLWPQWIETINQLTSKTNHLKINYGTHILLNSQSGKSDNKNFQAILSSLHAHKEPYQEVDPLQIEGLNPLDDCRPLRAVYLPEEGFVDSAVLMGALRMAAINHSDIIYKQGRVIKIDNRSNLFTAFTEDNNAFSASQIVLASGANTQNLLSSFPSLRKEVPMILSGFGCSFLLDAPGVELKSVIRSPNRAGACGIHMVPRKGDNSFYMGASNSISLTMQHAPRLRDNYYLIQRSIEQFNQELHKARIVKWFSGNRPVSIDMFPLVGESSIAGLWLLTGTYRTGLHLSPLLAQSIAKQIAGEIPSAKNPFQPTRKLIQTMTRQQAIDLFVEQYHGVGYEHKIQMPKIGWDEMFKDYLRVKIESIYSRLEVDIGVPVDILIMLFHDEILIPLIRDYYHQFLEETGGITNDNVTQLSGSKDVR